MTKKNTVRGISQIGLAGALAFCASSAMAIDFTGSVTVQNTIAVANNGDLSFGTISIAESAGDSTAGSAEYAALES